ncbi:hypothetical protein [Pullulanibacillus pueri]|nr:hypothetical protein [Pullulanibacillus pueri]
MVISNQDETWKIRRGLEGRLSIVLEMKLLKISSAATRPKIVV